MSDHGFFMLAVVVFLLCSLFVCESYSLSDSPKDIVKIVEHNSIYQFLNRNKSESSPKKRIIVDNFISKSELSTILNMLDENESMLSGLIGGLRFMPAYSIMMGRFLNQINQTFPDRVIMLCRLLRVIIYMWDFAEAYFDVPMIIETANANLRCLLNGTVNMNTWAHGIHADKCAFQANETDIYCSPNSSSKTRQYSSILYLNSIDGGDFIFVDPPSVGFDFRKIFSMTPPSAEQLTGVKTKLQLINSQSNKVSDLINHQVDMFTIVPPSPGRMLAFTSGPENLHGVTELLENKKRYTLSLWLTSSQSIEQSQKHKRRLLNTIKLYQ